MSFVVAIDGPAGSGKGTVTKMVAEKLDLMNIDTGALYRGVTLYMLRNSIDLTDKERIDKMLKTIEISLEVVNNENKVFLEGKDVSKQIRENDVTELVSPVARIVEIRNFLDNLSRKLSEGKNVIMEGRDIGTNVFPNADVKIYLDATPEERAKRRFKQSMEKGIDITYEEILKNIMFRDKNDSTSPIGTLKQAEDSIYIDSTNMTIEEVVEEVIRIIKEKDKNNIFKHK